MKLREVFRYELEHRVRSPSTWIYGVILFLVAMWMFLATADGGSAQVNAPVRIVGGSVLVGMFGMLVTAALFGDAAVRDVEAGMDPLIFTSSVRKSDYLAGRFLAALSVNAVLLLAIPLGFMAATRLSASFEIVGPFRIGAYVQSLVLMLLPNLFVVGAILFTIGALARQIVPVYLCTIGLFFGFIIALNFAAKIGNPILATLIDPSGIGAVQDVSRYWTESEQNTRLVGFPATIVWNRALWLAIAAVVLALLPRWYPFAHPDVRARGRKRKEPGLTTTERAGPVAVPRVAGSFDAWTAARQTIAVARNSLAEVAASRWFIVVLLACVGLTLLWGWNVGDTVFDTSTWPVTFLVTEVVLGVRITPLIYMLIAVYAGELVWKEREVRVAELADAAPVPEAVALLGRFLALVTMLATFQTAMLLGGLLIQALQGYFHFEPGLYLRVVFGMNLVNHVLLAALAMCIHVLVNQKYLGHMVVLLTFIFIRVAPVFGIRHHLFLYGTDPGWTYSDMNGFGPFVTPFVWFKVYWGAWALLLGVIALLCWVRGRESGGHQRLRVARARLIGSAARAAAVAIGLIAVLGGFIFYNTNVLNEYHGVRTAGSAQAGYERKYARFARAPQPMIVSANLRFEIHPDEPAAELRGTYQLVNRTDSAIDSVHVYVNPDIDVRSISLDRASRPVLMDDEAGYRILALERTLQPGDSLGLAFDVAFRARGFPNDDVPTNVASNGTRFDRRWLPFIGYQPAFELSNPDARSRFRLGPKRRMPAHDDAEARRYRSGLRNEDLVQVDVIIGTAGDQTAITPGVLQRSWAENGRRYFHYVTERPTSFGATVYSARYATLEDRWTPSPGTGQAVDLSILYHPRHRYNLDRMLQGMKAALAYYTTEFGPYPARQLRIVESPRYGGFGIAHPHTIGFTEDAFLSRVKENEVDQPFYGTAHEVAHQWWGGKLRGAMVRGHSFLSESLANYSAMMVTEKMYGPEVARRVYDFQMERYFLSRVSQSREVPVLDVEDQPYIAYRRGAVALYTLRERIGEERVNAALRRYVDRYRDAGPPYPTSRDLYAELLAVTPDSLHGLLSDLFETVTLWEVGTERAIVEPTGTGEYRVTIDVVAKKVRADSAGKETEVPMNEVVEIGVFARGEGEGLGEALYLQPHRVRSGKQTIVVTVSREPARAGVDPYRKLIGRLRDDNHLAVKRR